MQWRLLKLFPQCFGVVPNEDALTESQWRWLRCQWWVEEGMVVCPSCDDLSLGTYCQGCGAALFPRRQPCEQCGMASTGTYCSHCGHALRHAVTEAIDAGTFDWQAWAQSLTPFLGGLTPQELALLARG